MKQIILVLGIMSFALPAFAQWNASVTMNQGYEWNIFRNPDTFIQSSDTLGREDMWRNSVYNEGILSMDGEFNAGKGRIRLSGDISSNFYHQQREAQKQFYKIKASYRVKYARRKYFEIDPSFSSRQQEGIDQNDLVFSTRLSYKQFELPVHADFYLGDKAWLKFDFKYRDRKYEAGESSQTVFSSYQLQSEYKKRKELKSGWERAVSFENITEYRDQKNVSVLDDQILGARQFLSTKFRTTPSYGLISDRFRILLPVEFQLFQDRPTNNLNYLSWSTGIEIESEFDRSEWKVGAEYSSRRFQNFTIESGELLEYQSWLIKAEANIKLSNQIDFMIIGRYAMRNSTRDRLTTTAYRGYQTSYIETGFKVEL